jgi:hypothetical protein
VARLCLACQTTVANSAHYCPTCGRNLEETTRAWEHGSAHWRRFLDETGWYPGRLDESAGVHLLSAGVPLQPEQTTPRRVTARYLGGHPALNQPCRVLLHREEGTVVLTAPTWWPGRATRVPIALASVRSVTVQKTPETTHDDALTTAALGGARTGPLGLAFGAAVGRRRRVLRTVHVVVALDHGRAEMMFRPVDDASVGGTGALARIFRPGI